MPKTRRLLRMINTGMLLSLGNTTGLNRSFLLYTRWSPFCLSNVQPTYNTNFSNFFHEVAVIFGI